jgi:hypothetical protein
VPGALSAMRGEQRRASAMHEERPQISIALLGDLSQSAFLGTRALVRSKAQPGGEVTARREALDIADDGAKRSARQRTDAGDLA